MILAFIDSVDGYCLIAEDHLDLVDRSLTVGDVVKRNLLNAQSGIVLSTLLLCDLQPLLTPRVGEFLSSSSAEVPILGVREPNENITISSVPAHELRFWHSYRDGDYVIYQDWVGRVKDVYDDVTLRLQNGSIVVVDRPEELEEPLCIPGTERHTLKQKLERVGYHKYQTVHLYKEGYRPNAFPAQPCYPGQMVQTKKDNLRRGQWIYGAYDPKIRPAGVVVRVQCVQLEISWFFPNIFKPYREQVLPPPRLIDGDLLDSGIIKVYDHSNLPRDLNKYTLPGATYSPDIGFGHRARFKDKAGAAIKYSFRRPTSREGLRSSDAAQGYDMNLFLVVNTRTKILVQWQDSTITEEAAIAVSPYLNVDEYDVWPGDLVSQKDGEEAMLEIGTNIFRTRNIAVVQSANAAERVAKVRWFENTDVLIGGDDQSLLLSQGMIGSIGKRQSEVSLYEIAAYPALAKNRGDIVIVIPYPLPPPDALDIPEQASTYQALVTQARNAIQLGQPDLIASDPVDVGTSEGFEWVGEVVHVTLDGRVVVRLGALSEARDIILPLERIMVVASNDDESSATLSEEEDGDDSGGSDSEAASNWSTESGSVETISVTVEYEGGRRLDEDQDDSMWTTEDEELATTDPKVSTALAADRSPQLAVGLLGSEAMDIESKVIAAGNQKVLCFSDYPTMPPQFDVLESPVPNDHHFYDCSGGLTAAAMRRVGKEHEILRSSLPDGIFVRTWESALNLLRVVIVGPRDTPYELAPFVIDIQLDSRFPASPPNAFFHSWTNGIGRINPNLYEDGKICLSILGTWPADERNEGWTAKGSSILQVLVSLMGLVLVKEPYYNEAGFDVLVGTEESHVTSAQYTEKAFVMAKGFVKTALAQPPSGVADIINWLYLPSQPGPHLLELIVKESKALIPDSTPVPSLDRSASAGSGQAARRLSAGALVLLKRSVEWLESYLQHEEVAAIQA